MEELDIRVETTAVGDRYVMEAMRKGDFVLGGEQSGHIIFLNHTTTGDGILTAIQLVDILVESRKSLAELRQVMKRYPQILENVRVRDKHAWRDNEKIQQALRAGEELLGNNGRVLVRESGTEPIIRVMVEGPDERLLEKCVSQIVKVVREELGA
jgi:phosphoglucosamine mutase